MKTGIADTGIRRELSCMGTMLFLFLFGSAKGQAVEPTNIANLQLWLKADSGVYADQAGTTPAMNGTAVQRWEDQSGNDKHLTSVGTSENAILRSSVAGLCKRAAVEFTGTTNGILELVNQTLAITNDLTVFVVTQFNLITNHQTFIANRYSTFGWDFYHYSADLKMCVKATATWPKDFVMLQNGLSTNWLFATGLRIGTTNSVSVNRALTTSAVGSSGPISYHANSRLTVGGLSDNSQQYVGQMAEVVVYNRALTSGERSQVEAYLYARYYDRPDSSTPPIAHWKLDETSGPVLADSSKDGLYPMTLNGETPSAALGSADVPSGMPAGSKSVFFNANDRKGELATRAYTASLCGSTFTAAAWVKPNDSTPDSLQEFIFGPYGTTVFTGWSMRWYDGPFFSQQIGADNKWYGGVSSAKLAAGLWYHIVFQIEDNGTKDNYRLYVNGALANEALAGPNYTPSATASFVLGGRHDYTRWDGGLDDVQYYDYTLTAKDVAFLYHNPGATIPPPPTIVLIK
ncbi:MAG: hypothetical protein PHR35_00660 [Kiritimatiellae bacterium]|nr:hypothetical protein [Kiritimatiellia bacterium]